MFDKVASEVSHRRNHGCDKNALKLVIGHVPRLNTS